MPEKGFRERPKAPRLLVKLGYCLFAIGFLTAPFGCSPPSDDKATTSAQGREGIVQDSVRRLSNHDVRWDANIDGFSPTFTGEAARMHANMDSEAIPALLAALQDPDRFVVAHVLLTNRPGMECSTFPEYNGLAVTLHADGTVVIDPAQRFALARRWERWAKETPRPNRLPPAED